MAYYDECMGYADECVRLAAMTDDTIVRDQIMALALDWVGNAHAHNGDKRVIEFPRRIVAAVR